MAGELEKAAEKLREYPLAEFDKLLVDLGFVFEAEPKREQEISAIMREMFAKTYVSKLFKDQVLTIVSWILTQPDLVRTDYLVAFASHLMLCGVVLGDRAMAAEASAERVQP
jgi:hypothetical protein